MTSLRDNFGWGAAFGWTNANPCPALGNNWNGVICELTRVSKLDLTCGAVKLNAPFGHPIHSLSSMKEFTLRSCYASGIQATEFSILCPPLMPGDVNFCQSVGYKGFTNLVNLRKIRLDTGQTINGTISELFRESVAVPAQNGLNPTRFTFLTTLYLTDTKMSGTIPDGVMLFTNTTDIRLNYASFSGSLPATGNASKNLWLGGNQLEGVLPDYIRNATGTVYVRYNKFDVENTPAGNIDTLDPLWRTTQTVPPTNVIVSSTGAGTATLSWTPIAYQQHGGYYEVLSSTNPGGPYTSRGTTAASGGKTAATLTVAGLSAGINYFVVRTFTPAHTGVFPMGCTQEVDCVTENNPNNLTSINSAETSGNIPAPLTVTKTADTNGVCISGVDCSLREAIAAANATATDETITFDIPANDAGCMNGVCSIALTSGQLTIDSAATAGTLSIINSTGAANLRVSGNNQSRVFQVNSGGNLTLNNLIVTGGNSDIAGGIRNSGTLNISNCTLYGNSVSGDTAVGGGIFNSGTATITNSTISGNSAGGDGTGGGIANGGTLTINNSTVTNNSASLGGGIHGGANVRNSIIAGNTASFAPDFSGSLNSQGYNLTGNTQGTNISGDTTGNILNQNARLAPLGFYGGATQTHALLSNSPAINAGTSTNAPAADQRGAARVGNVDIGAFELNSSQNGGNFVAQLPGGTQNVQYSYTLIPETGATAYCISAGNLPSGLSGIDPCQQLFADNNPDKQANLSPSAALTISGIPLQNGTFNFSLRATNGGNTNVTDFVLNILGPTAANVSVSGRVLTDTGRGLRNAIVTMTDANGNIRTAGTNTFGYYRFVDVGVGETYIFAVNSKQYTFAPQVLNITEDLSDLNFIAIGERISR